MGISARFRGRAQRRRGVVALLPLPTQKERGDLMKLAIDVDGVLADTVVLALERLNKERGLNVTKDQIKKYGEPIADTDIGAILEKYLLDDSFLLAVEPICGACEAVKKLAEEHEIIIATNRYPDIDYDTIQWLINNDIPFHHYVNTRLSGKESVAADILVDDYPDSVSRFAERGGIAILFDQPWNQYDMRLFQRNVARAYDWEDVLQIVEFEGAPKEK